MPASTSRRTKGSRWLWRARDVEPAFGGALLALLGHQAGGMGLVACSAIASISSVAAISRLSGRSISRLRRSMSRSEIWRRSSRRCAVMPSAPASAASRAARTGSGWPPPRALRMVATWSMLTPSRRPAALHSCGSFRSLMIRFARNAAPMNPPVVAAVLILVHEIAGRKIGDDAGGEPHGDRRPGSWAATAAGDDAACRESRPPGADDDGSGRPSCGRRAGRCRSGSAGWSRDCSTSVPMAAASGLPRRIQATTSAMHQMQPDEGREDHRDAAGKAERDRGGRPRHARDAMGQIARRAPEAHAGPDEFAQALAGAIASGGGGTCAPGRECVSRGVSLGSAPRALDGVDGRRRAQGGDDVGQVLHVLDLDVDHHLEEIHGAVGDLQIGDVAFALADHRRQAAEAAGLVGDDDMEPADMGLAPSPDPICQATSSQRSGVSAKLSSVSQSMVWMVTPLPVVTMPTMRSPGSGWQQPAKVQRHAGDQAGDGDGHAVLGLWLAAPRPLGGERHHLVVGCASCMPGKTASITSRAVTVAGADRGAEVVDGRRT